MTDHLSRRSKLKGYPPHVFLKLAIAHKLPGASLVLPDRHMLVSSPGGKMFLNLSESPMMRSRVLGVYEYWKTLLFKQIVKPGMTIVDVGVNKAYFSLLCAKVMGDKGRVLAFEPDPTNCEWIQKSIDANQYQSIALHRVALSNKPGTLTFYPGKKSGWGSFFFDEETSDPNQDPITVQTARLDDVLAREGIDDVDLMKIDVQGADLLVLKGAEHLLRSSNNLQLILDIDVTDPAEQQELYNLLVACGFSLFNIGRNLTRINSLAEADRDIYAVKEA